MYVGHIWTIGPHLPCHHGSFSQSPLIIASKFAYPPLPVLGIFLWVDYAHVWVTSSDECSPLDEGGQVNWPPFPHSTSTISFSHAYLSITQMQIEERVSHLPVSQMYVLWGILAPFTTACLYFLCCMLSTFWCVVVCLVQVSFGWI